MYSKIFSVACLYAACQAMQIEKRRSRWEPPVPEFVSIPNNPSDLYTDINQDTAKDYYKDEDSYVDFGEDIEIDQSEQNLGATQSCRLSIERSIAGPHDYTSIIGSGEKFTDDYWFPADSSMIYWPAYPKPSNSLKSYANYITGYFRPYQVDPNATMFGTSIQPYDIKQGSVGDCYFLVCASAIAEFPERLKKIVLTDLNDEGIVAFRVFIKGRPEVITIDDRIPSNSSKGYPIFAKASS